MGGSPSCQIAAVDMEGPEAMMVKEKVKNNCVMIFSKTYCPYCKMAKKAFKDLGVPYNVYELDKQADGLKVQDVLDGMTGARTKHRFCTKYDTFPGGKDFSREETPPSTAVTS
ncbi:Glutaredoxin-2, mitochondrial [Portunus trituberculatus]|uniref:Glutaredoxin-2, mitochondrial n=1 Tax=Portunus trituberculatus TaxID=210409 RepID=A0A5B7JIP0_PORTR|nr:Glutaredoxin-2, mitochondrial [Portunus trituberculatus]